MKKYLSELSKEKLLLYFLGGAFGLKTLYLLINFRLNLNISIIYYLYPILFCIFLLKDKKKYLSIPVGLILFYDIYKIIQFLTLGNLSKYVIINIFPEFIGTLLFLIIVMYTTIPKFKNKKTKLTKAWYLPIIFWIIPYVYSIILGGGFTHYIFSIIEYLLYLLIIFVLVKNDKLKDKFNISEIVKKAKPVFAVIIFIAIVVLIMFSGNGGSSESNPYDEANRLERMSCRSRSNTYFKCSWSFWEQDCVCKMR